jgi:hypothetical protein
MVLVRDGTDEQLTKHADWARDVFVQEKGNAAEQSVRASRGTIHHNPLAIAALGLVHLWNRHRTVGDRNVLVEMAGLDDPTGGAWHWPGLKCYR